ncbi:MAG: hypothetical protein ABWX59_00325 [Microbacteriaceae bacterium]
MAGDEKSGSAFGNWIEKLNVKLRPYIGAPPLGPYNEPPLPPRETHACPLCGHPMSEHRVDRSGERTQLYCPETPAVS